MRTVAVGVGVLVAPLKVQLPAPVPWVLRATAVLAGWSLRQVQRARLRRPHDSRKTRSRRLRQLATAARATNLSIASLSSPLRRHG
jgi:hypothetical protein